MLFRSPTNGNKLNYETKGVDGINWLEGYANQVEVIANANENRNTREQAEANIALSFLTPQKLTPSTKGVPVTPVFSVVNEGTGIVKTKITNGADYNPSQVTFIAIEASAGGVLTLSGADLKVVFSNIGSITLKTITGRSKTSRITSLTPGVDYLVYAFAQNGKKLVSALSAPVVVKG